MAEFTYKAPEREQNIPTVNEVKKYCNEYKIKVNEDSFVNYYSERNWSICGKKIKNWKAIVRVWAQLI